MFEFTLYGDYKYFKTHSDKYSGFKIHIHYDTDFIIAKQIHSSNNIYYNEYTNVYYYTYYTLFVYSNLLYFKYLYKYYDMNNIIVSFNMKNVFIKQFVINKINIWDYTLYNFNVKMNSLSNSSNCKIPIELPLYLNILDIQMGHIKYIKIGHLIYYIPLNFNILYRFKDYLKI